MATVVQVYQKKMGTGVSEYYNVPQGKTVTFSEWEVGTQKYRDSSFKSAIYWDADGSGNNMVKIDQVYTIAKCYKRALDSTTQFVSTGKSRIVVNRHIWGQHGARETYVRWVADIS